MYARHPTEPPDLDLMAWETVHVEIESPRTVPEVRRQWIAEYTDWMAKGKYAPTATTERAITYTRTYKPGGFIFLAIITFPIGLLFLLATRQAVLTVEFHNRDPVGTRMTITGIAQPKGAASIRRLEHDALATTTERA